MTLKDDLLRDVAEDILERIKYEIELAGMDYTGALKESFKVIKTDDGYAVVSELVYSIVQEDGRLPGKMPPVKVLIPWVFQKIGGKDEKELKSIAYAVARKIGEKGTEPKHYIKRSLFTLEADNT